MTDDFIAKSRSDKEVTALAKRALKHFCQEDQKWVDVIICLNSKDIWTVFGLKRLLFRIIPDSEMGSADGMTSASKDLVTIDVKASVYDAALLGDGRARNTLAHELGHGVMHERKQLPRRANGNAKFRWIKSFESAEHQANVFARAFLIDENYADGLANASEVAIEAGVSFECAQLFFKEATKRRDTHRSSEKVRQLVALFKAEITQKEQQPAVKYLDAPCPNCGERRVFPVGAKFMCQVCDRVSDTYPEGDLEN